MAVFVFECVWLTNKLTDEINKNQVQFLFNHETKKWSKVENLTFILHLGYFLTILSQLG